MDAQIQEPPPADVSVPGAPPGADPQVQPDVIPDSVSKLLRNLNLDPEQPDAQAAKPAAPDKRPEPKPKPAAAAAAAPTTPEPKPADVPADPGIKLRKPKISRPELPLAQAPAPATPAAKDEPYKPDPQFESGLDEEQREMLADARFMEERFPDKYKGWTARTAKFLKEHADLAGKEDFDAQSPEYKTWLERNQPRLTREQIREIEEVRVADRVNKEWNGKYTDLQHKMFVRDSEPKLEEEGRKIFVELSNTALPDDIASAIKKDGFEKANQLYALEIKTAQQVLSVATEDLKELRRVATKDPETGRPLQAVVNDPTHPKFEQHQRLSTLIGYLDEAFKKEPAEKQLRDGKWFVTRDEWAQIRPDQRHRFWTHKLDDYIPMAKANVKTAVQMAIARKREEMSALGWQPPAPAPVVAPQVKSEPPQRTNTPRIPAAVPTPGNNDAVMNEIDARAARMVAHLNRE